ncbi:MAG: 2,3-bisphosphoglycerate-dependent phosphoglycerate mutase [Candidatus Kapabacteria bacterium]|nr:2,3-bisphosphoglycerate-dependent phosphoglycerate mutase [Candidatus Kapabacteria bacterium]MDW8224997.1 2,3-bisphosphoglycerate-dependent phosphoglycerate mutase [Bacteroidota bacterium]
MPLLILLRHGESLWNRENRFTGWVDIDLSPRGEEEARRAGELLRAFRVDIIFTSALRRAWRTAEIVREILGKELPIERTPALNERHYGQLQGLNKDEVRLRYGEEQFRRWRRSYDVAPPGGESLEDTQRRVLPYYRQCILPELRRGNNVLIVAHGNSLRALLMELEKISPEQIPQVEIPTGVPYVYELEEGSLEPLRRQIVQPEIEEAKL